MDIMKEVKSYLLEDRENVQLSDFSRFKLHKHRDKIKLNLAASIPYNHFPNLRNMLSHNEGFLLVT